MVLVYFAFLVLFLSALLLNHFSPAQILRRQIAMQEYDQQLRLGHLHLMTMAREENEASRRLSELLELLEQERREGPRRREVFAKQAVDDIRKRERSIAATDEREQGCLEPGNAEALEAIWKGNF